MQHLIRIPNNCTKLRLLLQGRNQESSLKMLQVTILTPKFIESCKVLIMGQILTQSSDWAVIYLIQLLIYIYMIPIALSWPILNHCSMGYKMASMKNYKSSFLAIFFLSQKSVSGPWSWFQTVCNCTKVMVDKNPDWNG